MSKIEYNAKSIEDQYRSLYQRPEGQGKEAYYCLTMFPYPSGQLHMGHVRVYTIGDVLTRYKSLQGHPVFQPMGWDAFGLPAENAAIKHGIHPKAWTEQNIAQMKQQLVDLGFDYDWDHELRTCDPEYYHWQQWLFLQMYERGLVYRQLADVNWDPVDQTVLANEQVIDGRGWRSGALVERKRIHQWFIKITDYADDLLSDLDDIQWPEQVKTMQRNWIGRSNGTEICFSVLNHDDLWVYTTRPDTLMGVSCVVIAPSHPIALAQAKKNSELASFIELCQQQKVAEADVATADKKGMFTGLSAKHPISQELVPIWVANYVLMDYGHGAVMCVPAHDQRDFEFAAQYQLPIKQVIQSETTNTLPITDKGTLINSLQFDGLSSDEAISKITQSLVDHQLGKSTTQYRLRDWCISRQRFWGCPIPIIYCDDCGVVTPHESSLPIIPSNHSESSENDEQTSVLCPKCGKSAKAETDTFDTFMDSSWYYLRYPSHDQNHAMIDQRSIDLLPVDMYVGGIEHAILHLLYARFINKVIYNMKLIDNKEPFKQLLTQGMVIKNGSKMSKSKGNVVSPIDLYQKYGADVIRFFTIFAAPVTMDLEWSDSGIEGASRFLQKVHTVAFTDYQYTKPISPSIANDANQLFQKIHDDYERQHLNTIASGCMKLFKLIIQCRQELCDDSALWRYCLMALYPIAPHISVVVWHHIFPESSLCQSDWPALLDVETDDSTSIALQINGKMKGMVSISSNTSQNNVLDALRNSEKSALLEGLTIKKVIFVPGKIINLVVVK
ncbi:MAG: leucine--tRNA ligase [Candidatus Comchoanobacterales bacterium]